MKLLETVAIVLGIIGASIIFSILAAKLIYFFVRVIERKKEDIYILNFIVQKHLAGELVWESQEKASRIGRLMRANIGREALNFWIWKDGSCWLEVGELRLKSGLYPELKLIMKDLKREFKEPSPHKEILHNLGIDKEMHRHKKIETIIPESKIEKFKKLFEK